MLVCLILGVLWYQDNEQAVSDKGRLEELNEAYMVKVDSLKISLFERLKDIHSLEEQLDNQPKAKIIYVKINTQLSSIDTLDSGELFGFFSGFNTGDNQ